MKFLKLGKDIVLHCAEKHKARVLFKIVDHEAVEEFLSDQDLINFLTDLPVGDEAGCYLQIEKNSEFLIIGRTLKPTTDRPIACMSLISSLMHYILSPNETVKAEIEDIIGGLGCGEVRIPNRHLPRGVALLARGEAVVNLENCEEKLDNVFRN